jgi:hypothetical protein
MASKIVKAKFAAIVGVSPTTKLATRSPTCNFNTISFENHF